MFLEIPQGIITQEPCNIFAQNAKTLISFA